MNFQEAVEAVRRAAPETPLGLTAQQGVYFEKARRLNNFEMHPGDPTRFGARQVNGKTMWVYLSVRGTVCCGDKPWD